MVWSFVLVIQILDIFTELTLTDFISNFLSQSLWMLGSFFKSVQYISHHKFQPSELKLGKYEHSHRIGEEVRNINH